MNNSIGELIRNEGIRSFNTSGASLALIVVCLVATVFCGYLAWGLVAERWRARLNRRRRRQYLASHPMPTAESAAPRPLAARIVQPDELAAPPASAQPEVDPMSFEEDDTGHTTHRTRHGRCARSGTRRLRRADAEAAEQGKG